MPGAGDDDALALQELADRAVNEAHGIPGKQILHLELAYLSYFDPGADQVVQPGQGGDADLVGLQDANDGAKRLPRSARKRDRKFFWGVSFENSEADRGGEAFLITRMPAFLTPSVVREYGNAVLWGSVRG